MSAFEERKDRALAAIKQSYGSSGSDDGVALFISHHLKELPDAYWVETTGTAAPRPEVVLGLLEFVESWGEAENEYFDFTLPGNVTDYRMCVHFDDTGEIDDISMES